MKKQNLVVLAAVASSLLLSGCASGTKGAYSGNIEDDQVTEGTAGVAAPVANVESAPDPTFQTSVNTENNVEVTGDNRGDANSLLNERIIYFDFDKSVVREEALPALQAHADFLIANKALAVVLGGHADERGSNEYNLALGQRRANAVRDILASYGVDTVQIEPLSFGEEQPRAEGHDEAAWQQNRRVEIRYSDE